MVDTALQGVMPVTPFTEHGQSVDELALAEHVERCVLADVDGLVPCGGTGDFAAMTMAERQRVLEVVAGQAAERARHAHTGGFRRLTRVPTPNTHSTSVSELARIDPAGVRVISRNVDRAGWAIGAVSNDRPTGCGSPVAKLKSSRPTRSNPARLITIEGT